MLVVLWVFPSLSFSSPWNDMGSCERCCQLAPPEYRLCWVYKVFSGEALRSSLCPWCFIAWKVNGHKWISEPLGVHCTLLSRATLMRGEASPSPVLFLKGTVLSGLLRFSPKHQAPSVLLIQIFKTLPLVLGTVVSREERKEGSLQLLWLACWKGKMLSMPEIFLIC